MTIFESTDNYDGPYTSLFRHVSRLRSIAFVQFCDFVVFFVLGLWWLHKMGHDTSFGGVQLDAVLALCFAATIHCVFKTFGLYDFAVLTHASQTAGRTLFAASLSFAPFLAPLTQQPTAYSLVPAAFGLAGLVFYRLALAALAAELQTLGLAKRRIYIIGEGSESALSFKSMLERMPDNRIIGVWDIAGQSDSDETALEGALRFLSGTPVDLVILKIPHDRPARIVEMARLLRRVPRTVVLAPALNHNSVISGSNFQSPYGLDGFVTLNDRPFAGWRWVAKDLQDRLIALLLLFILSPTMLLIAVAIKLSDPGPVLFRQERRGYDGKTFKILKFRTMRTENSTSNQALLKLATRDDPRVFPFGRFLRKTSLDELPQLINVLIGDMWIIGPRPHSPRAQAGGLHYADAWQDYLARYRTKPGITGWAQVNGWRGPTDTVEQLRKRIEHDLYYIDNWSLLLEITILYKTLFCVFGNKNAF
jgi:exopolysaccharide biosynthesis polyprenyl glycosylphosphotransferase